MEYGEASNVARVRGPWVAWFASALAQEDKKAARQINVKIARKIEIEGEAGKGEKYGDGQRIFVRKSYIHVVIYYIKINRARLILKLEEDVSSLFLKWLLNTYLQRL